ncbi:ribonuclease [Sphingomonas sp. NSE70-1]|uniref:Ribonuclease n=1 Tax=Sphingomonas caseinilyticus TaxID=2908205 RepID=A0ABT0RVF5_9SPHN|nr:ribonuclease [Sphingomonas caseinilyticus]MCL6699019.1 ribonuclease [Sphingomonas caseinilyticus]
MPSPEWLIERGIGETRAVLVDDGRIIEARIIRDGDVPAGTVLTAQLKSTGRNAVAIADGQEYLLPKGAPGVTEGARLNIEVTREALGGSEPWKRPLARKTDLPPRPAPTLQGRDLQFPAASDELESAGWSDLLDEARSGLIGFPGGELRVSLTPAMTLIDVDGALPPAELAVAGARAAAAAIRRHGIGGSIGIDLPTVASKTARLAAAEAVDEMLPKPFERTAVNGFGFLQIVRPRTHASLLELASDSALFEAAALYRWAAREVGSIRIVAHPAVVAVLERNPTLLDRLSMQVGGVITLRADASIAISAGHAERP